MDLKNEIDVDAPVDTVWEAVNDVERIAPCLPGAQLEEVDEEAGEYRGIVKVKVGPITAQYKGAASFVEQDAEARRVRLEAKGRDSRGAGTADAVITATLTEATDGVTRLTVDTDLTVTGKVAQFGRGALADVSEKLMGQFAGNLETMLEEDAGTTTDRESEPDADRPAQGAADEPIPAAPKASEAPQTSSVRSIDAPEAEPVDLVEIAGASFAKRLVPVVGLVVALLVIRWIVRRRVDEPDVQR